MAPQGLIQRVKGLMCRAWLLYAIALFLFYQCTNLYLMKVKTINHVVPQDMSTQAQFMLNPRFNHEKPLTQSINYYKTVVKIIPNSWADWGLLGYAYFFKGDLRRAEYCFAVAGRGDKDLFWFPYNLGMVYLRQGRFDDAQASFRRALSVQFPKTLQLMHSYKIYNMLLPEVLMTGYNVEQGLFDTVINAKAMLAACEMRLPIDPNDPRFFPRMF